MRFIEYEFQSSVLSTYNLKKYNMKQKISNIKNGCQGFIAAYII